MHDDLRALLSNPRVFPVELTLTNGEKIRIPHPDFVHFPPRMKDIVYFPPHAGALFELIAPGQVAKVRARKKSHAA